MTPRMRVTEGGNWFFIHNLLFELETESKPYLIAVYACLCRRANKKQICYPSQETIAKEVGCSVRKVKSIIKELAERHFILIKRTGYRQKTRNKYLLVHPTEWLMRSAHNAPRSMHHLPPIKTKLNNKKINKKEIQRELHERIAGLATQMTLRPRINSP